MARLQDTIGLPIYLAVAAYAFLTGPNKFIEGAREKADRAGQKVERSIDYLGDKVDSWFETPTATAAPPYGIPPSGPTSATGTSEPRGYIPAPRAPPTIPPGTPPSAIPTPGSASPVRPPSYGSVSGRLPTPRGTTPDALPARPSTGAPSGSPAPGSAAPIGTLWQATPREINPHYFVIDDATGQNPPSPFYFQTKAHAIRFIKIVNGFASVYRAVHTAAPLPPTLVGTFAEKIDFMPHQVIGDFDLNQAEAELRKVEANPNSIDDLVN